VVRANGGYASVERVCTSPAPNPVRPFANLTFITPCAAESDHPNFSGHADGPQWLPYVVNAIGSNTTYWANTAVIVTWDDWGGWYDNYNASPWPYHPLLNAWGNPQDPNEWGFRVPLLVISPWAKPGYISPTLRSQGAILTFIEDALGLGTLGGDDKAQAGDDLADMFDFTGSARLPYTGPPSAFVPTNNGTCPYKH
jgi:phospholipase C